MYAKQNKLTTCIRGFPPGKTIAKLNRKTSFNHFDKKRVLEKSQQEPSHVRIFSKLWETIAWIRLIPSDRRGKSSFTCHLLCFVFFALQMLTNVPTGHMIVTSMPTVTILWDPSHARANQHISETEKTVQASVSF